MTISAAMNYFIFQTSRSGNCMDKILREEYLRGNYLPMVIIKELDLGREFYLNRIKAWEIAANTISTRLILAFSVGAAPLTN